MPRLILLKNAAPGFQHLTAYLPQHADPATPEDIRGYLRSAFLCTSAFHIHPVGRHFQIDLTRLPIGSLPFRSAALPIKNSRPLIAQTPLHVPFPITSSASAFRCKISIDKQRYPPYTLTHRKPGLIQTARLAATAKADRPNATPAPKAVTGTLHCARFDPAYTVFLKDRWFWFLRRKSDRFFGGPHDARLAIRP